MKTYSVLWFDDEHHRLESVKEEALRNSIRLLGYTNAEDGIKELERNLFSYDAIIVDGNFYSSSRSSGDAVDDKALVSVARFLDSVRDKKDMPWFIFSGQANFTKQKNPFADVFKDNEVYDKNKDEDSLRLWADIKTAADKQKETQIRHKYVKVFDVCTETYIGSEATKHIMPILSNIEEPGAGFEEEAYFNGLRKVIELIFRACNRYGFLHDKCISNDIVNLSWSSIFMSGKEVSLPSGEIISSAKPHFPVIISNAVKSILEITSVASHTEGENKDNGKSNLKDYRKWVNSPYLLYSLTFQLMDVLLWFKNYTDENNNVEANKANWNIVRADTVAQHSGIICQDENRNYYCDDYLLSYQYIQTNFTVGDKVIITDFIVNNNSKTKDRYRYFATKIEKQK